MKILIADDEDYTREGLLEEIDWEEFGIDEIMQAVNGEEALKIVKWFRPDIVLSDIRMPKMDGITFAEEMLRLIPQSKLIFISGYMETEYLKSAIRLSVIDYIEKPIDVAQVRNALRKAAEAIDREQKTKEADEGNREFCQQRLFELLTHREMDVRMAERLAREVGFPLNGEYVCIVVQFPRSRKAVGEELEAVLEMVLETGGKAIGTWQDNVSLEVIISYPDRFRYRLNPFYRRILDRWTDCKVAAGIEAEDYRNIYNSSRTARAAMNCAFYQPERKLFEIDENILQKKFMEPGIYGAFLRVLPEGAQKMTEWFQDLFGDLASRRYYQKEVSIRDEVEMCEAYMEIQKRRYKGRICYEVEVDEDILECLIPKITLQPFLENAIIHGINEKAEGRGTVILNGWMEDGRITLSVTDDGEGMREEDKKKSGQGSHYGLTNIEHRLGLFFGESIPVQIESSPGIGTCVIINIPGRTGMEEVAENER